MIFDLTIDIIGVYMCECSYICVPHARAISVEINCFEGLFITVI